MASPLIKFNTDFSINQPKFELCDAGSRTIQIDQISLSIFDGDAATATTTAAETIIDLYKTTNDVEYITRTMVVPFTFLLVDLDIHKPQYTAFFVVQPFDCANYSVTADLLVTKSATTATTATENVKGDLLMRGAIYGFTLDAKAISQWEFNRVRWMPVHVPPPFYITENDFYNYLEDARGGGDNTAAKFLSDILQQFATINEGVLYNYSVERAIREDAKFTIADYIQKQTLVAFYLLVYPVLRFEKRREIAEKTLA